MEGKWSSVKEVWVTLVEEGKTFVVAVVVILFYIG